MAEIISTAVASWKELSKQADPRVENFFMMSSPWPSFLLTAVYVYVVKFAGPKFMETRKPYEIRSVMLVYNFSMVALSAYIMIEFGLAGWFTGYSWRCQPVDYSSHPKALRMVNVCWWFYFSKFLEFADTIFFVIRKKYNQVSFLHVFHHSIMPVSWWFGVKFVPGGFGTFHGMLNAFIHFIMYIYYGLSALGPRYQKYLWWKRYMTKMQITQFIVVCLHAVQLLFIDCGYPQLFAYWIGVYAIIFLLMFADFYRKSYKRIRQQSITKNGSLANGVKIGAKED